MVGAAVVVNKPAVPEYRKAFAVKPEIVTLVPTVIADGRLSVTEPVAADAVIWLAVPARLVTPVLAMVNVPLPLVTLIPVPARSTGTVVYHWVPDEFCTVMVSPTGNEMPALTEAPSIAALVCG